MGGGMSDDTARENVGLQLVTDCSCWLQYIRSSSKCHGSGPHRTCADSVCSPRCGRSTQLQVVAAWSVGPAAQKSPGGLSCREWTPALSPKPRRCHSAAAPMCAGAFPTGRCGSPLRRPLDVPFLPFGSSRRLEISLHSPCCAPAHSQCHPPSRLSNSYLFDQMLARISLL